MLGGGCGWSVRQVEEMYRHVRHGVSTPFPSRDPVTGAPAGESRAGCTAHPERSLELPVAAGALRGDSRRRVPSRRVTVEGLQPVRGDGSGQARPQGSPWFPPLPESPGPLLPSLAPVPGEARGRSWSWQPEDPLSRAAEGGQARKRTAHVPAPIPPQLRPMTLTISWPAPLAPDPPPPRELSAVAPESSLAGTPLTGFPQ